MKRAIYVDYENVNISGLKAIEELTKDDIVKIFIGAQNSKLSMKDAERIFSSEATVEVINNKYIGKNALDFIIMVHMGYDIAKELAKSYFIISKDKGYDPAIHEMKKMSGLMVARREEISMLVGEKKSPLKAVKSFFGFGKDKEEPDTTEHHVLKNGKKDGKVSSEIKEKLVKTEEETLEEQKKKNTYNRNGNHNYRGNRPNNRNGKPDYSKRNNKPAAEEKNNNPAVEKKNDNTVKDNMPQRDKKPAEEKIISNVVKPENIPSEKVENQENKPNHRNNRRRKNNHKPKNINAQNLDNIQENIRENKDTTPVEKNENKKSENKKPEDKKLDNKVPETKKPENKNADKLVAESKKAEGDDNASENGGEVKKPSNRNRNHRRRNNSHKNNKAENASGAATSGEGKPEKAVNNVPKVKEKSPEDIAKEKEKAEMLAVLASLNDE